MFIILKNNLLHCLFNTVWHMAHMYDTWQPM